MPETRKDYGLIYSDDFCATLVDYDTPFDGVKSFAIEKGAENLLPANVAVNFESAVGSSETTKWRLARVSCTPVSPAKAIITTTDASGTQYFYHKVEGLTPETSYVFSINIKDYNTGKLFWLENSDAGATKTNGTRYHISLTSTAEGSVQVYLRLNAPASIGTYFEVWNPQLEAGTIPTQYVEPSFTRPAGKFLIPKEKLLEKGITHDNYVVNFWAKFKPTAAEHYTGNNNNDSVIFQQLNAAGNDGVQLGLLSEKFYFAAYSGGSNVTTPNYVSSAGWHNLHIARESAATKLYIDGTLTNSLTANLNTTLNDFLIGHHSTLSRPFNGLLSNFFIGKHRKSDGTVIWTDDYIKAVYNARKPFVRNASGLIL